MEEQGGGVEEMTMPHNHTACDKRLAELGGATPCCYCEPHDDCDLLREEAV